MMNFYVLIYSLLISIFKFVKMKIFLESEILLKYMTSKFKYFFLF